MRGSPEKEPHLSIPRPRPPRRALLAAGLIALLALAGCGSSGSKKTSTAGTTHTAKAPSYQGAEATPPQAAPPLRLANYDGRMFDLGAHRGQAVLVTFLYTHCPDVCPLIAGHLHSALAQLGANAAKVHVVAVSADPVGDTPATVRQFLSAHQMLGKMDYLIGSKAQLQAVWRAWNVQAQPDKTVHRLVAHSALVYGISGGGDITTLYPSNFKVGWIVHDVPLLANA
jgi:protein SCO1/2